MSRVVLSIGSNIGDRLGRLQAAVDDLGAAVLAVSPVYETDAWGGVEQAAFLNAIVIATDPDLDAHGWLRRAQQIESANERVRERKWGPRTLDVDLVCCVEDVPPPDREVVLDGPDLTLPHPLAHRRAFVLRPWLAVQPDACLLVDGRHRMVAELLDNLEPGERDGVRNTELVLQGPRR